MTGTQVDKVDRGYVVGQGEAVLGHEPGVMATRISTAGSLTLIEQNVQGGPPWHVHSREDECFYVLGGLLTVRCGDDVFDARTHSFVFLPRGVPHTFEVVGDSARVLIIAVPGGLEEYFRELHQAPDQSSREQVAEKYGIHVL